MMNRRDIFRIAAGAAAGAGLPAGVMAHASQATGTPAREVPQSARREHIVTSDGTSLFLRDWGEGRPVLFLAGWTLPSDFWCYQMLGLVRRGHRVLAYDRRGHGRSSDPGRGYTHERLADDLAEVIRALGLEGATLVAHSMGSTEIARYFARHGGRGVERVVLVGTITPFLMRTPDNPRGLDRALLAQLRAPLERDFAGWIETNARPFFVAETSRDMIEWGKGLMLQTSLLAALELARLNAETDFRQDVERIAVPTLVIHGDADASAPLALTAQATAGLLPDGRLVVYEGAPHGLPLTHVERLNQDLATFIGAA